LASPDFSLAPGEWLGVFFGFGDEASMEEWRWFLVAKLAPRSALRV